MDSWNVIRSFIRYWYYADSIFVHTYCTTILDGERGAAEQGIVLISYKTTNSSRQSSMLYIVGLLTIHTTLLLSYEDDAATLITIPNQPQQREIIFLPIIISSILFVVMRSYDVKLASCIREKDTHIISTFFDPRYLNQQLQQL